MLYYLGSHRWLWGKGGVGVSARDHAAPVHSSSRTPSCHSHPPHMPFTRLPHIPGRLPSSHPFTSHRPLAIAIHPPASLTTGLWWYGSSRYWVARPQRARQGLCRALPPNHSSRPLTLLSVVLGHSLG